MERDKKKGSQETETAAELLKSLDQANLGEVDKRRLMETFASYTKAVAPLC